MKAWILNSVGNISYEEKDIPVPEKDEVLVKMHAAGICGSDIPRVYHNGAHNMPLIIGHEFSGEIVESTPTDRQLIGKRVGIFPLLPCKKCPACLKKQYEMCSHYNYLGSRCNGGFAEYVVVPKWNLIELPNEVTYEQAAMLEPMAVSVHAIRKSEITDKQSAVVWGAGTIGLLIAMFLVDRGIGDIFVVANHKHQVERAKKIGVKTENIFCLQKDNDEEICDSKAATVWLKDMTNGLGPDVFFECVGKTELLTEAVSALSCGGTVVTVGNPYSDLEMPRDIYWTILRHQLKIVGTWNSSFYGDDDIESGQDDWHFVLERLIKGNIKPQELISHMLSLSELDKGLKVMHDKTDSYMKVMVKREL